jgi:hypothetical protein
MAPAMAHAQLVPDLRGEVEENVLGIPRPGTATSPEAADVTAAPAALPGARPGASVLDGQPAAVTFDNAEPFDADDDTGDDADAVGALIENAEEPDPDDPARFGRTEAVGSIGPLATGTGSVDEDPFAPLGLRLGTFTVFTTLDLGVSHTRTRSTFANVGATPQTYGTADTQGTFGEAALTLRGTSDWSRHAVDFGFSGRLPVRVSGEADTEPEARADAALRMDIDRETQLNLSAAYAYRKDDPGSAAVAIATDPLLFPGLGTTDDPVTQTFSGAVGLQRQAGPFSALAEINGERQVHDSATLTDGTVVSQDDLDYVRYGGRLRGGYSVSPLLTPFAEIEYSQRVMDVRPDPAGIDRNAARYALRLGTAFDGGEKLSGEIALGYVWEDLADAALADIGGLSVVGSLNWSPRRQTNVSAGIGTTTTTSGAADVSGALVYAANLGVTHRARADLELNGALNIEYDDVTGAAEDEITVGGTVGATWWFNRFVGLTGRIGHERTYSDDPTEETGTTNAFVGVRLQR